MARKDSSKRKRKAKRKSSNIRDMRKREVRKGPSKEKSREGKKGNKEKREKRERSKKW